MKTRKVYGLWYGGSSYATPDPTNRLHIDEGHSVAALKRLFIDRLTNRNGYTPCVDDTAEMWVMFSDPYMNDGLYPDRIIKIGPKGGTRIERC